jgi:Fic family protein
MKQPYKITSTILTLITTISEKVGTATASLLHRSSPESRKSNRVKAVHAALQMEGNKLTEDQITELLDNRRVIGAEKDIEEAVNAIAVYSSLSSLDALSIISFLDVHRVLMAGLTPTNGWFRTETIEIVKGNTGRLAPPADELPGLMSDLFEYLDQGDHPALISSCVAHYEIEFIRPFMDGNGKMGRLWQTLLLTEAYPIFKHLPFEAIVKQNQQEYNSALAASNKAGRPTKFIEFMLGAINQALDELLLAQTRRQTKEDRVKYFIVSLQESSFTRKGYMALFPELSSATASRDLRYGVEHALLSKTGDKRNTVYQLRRSVNG